MSDHQGQITIHTTTERGLASVNAFILHSLAYDAIDVMDNDNLATTVSAQIQVSIVLIGIVRKLSLEPIILG